MIHFASIFPSERAALGVKAASKNEALTVAVRLFAEAELGVGTDKLLDEVLAREALSSTALGEGVAVPHALCDSIGKTAMSAVRLAKPIPFQAPDGVPVDLIFLIVGPKSDTAGHLRLLSKLVRILHDPEFRREARAASSGAAFAALLSERD